ncbi:MAG: enoyl-CoA hydratase/isomerase family protein [Acidobacteriota bacterium]
MFEIIDHDSIRELRIARPPVNALSPELIAGLRKAIEDAPGMGIEAMILSGRPGMFSAGLDVPHLLGLDRDAIAPFLDNLFGLMRAIALAPVPIAAAVTGHSPAGGAIMAIFCDTRIMAEGSYKIGFNEVEVGLPVPGVVYRALERRVGARQAERLCLSGSLITADEAYEIGFVDALAPAEKVAERALTWCQKLLALPPTAVRKTRQVTRQDLHRAFEELQVQTELFVDAWFSDETQGAMRALVARLAERK